MSKMLKKIALGLGAILLVIVVLFAALIGYGMYGASVAKDKATKLCTSAAVGAKASAVRDRALALGAVTGRADWREVEGGQQELVAIFPGNTPRSGYQCTITAKGGLVTTTAVVALD